MKINKIISVFVSAALLMGGAGQGYALTIGANGEMDNILLNRYKTGGMKITMSEAIETALKDNTSVKNAAKDLSIYSETVRQYKSYAWPTLSASGSYSRALKKNAFYIDGDKMEVGSNNTYSAGLDASWLIYSGGQVSSGIKIADMYRKSGLYQFADVKNDVRRRVAIMCYTIMLSSALIGVQEEYLDINKQHLKETRAKYKQGLASNLDVLTQQVKVSNAEPAVIKAKNDYELANLQLKQLLNMGPEEKVSLDWTSRDLVLPNVKKLEELYALADKNNPTLVLSKIAVDMAEQSISLERAGHMPTLSAFGNYYYQGLTDNGFPRHKEHYYWTSSVGLQLNIPLFEGFKVNSLVKQKEYAYQKAINDYESAVKQVRIDVKRSWLNLNEAKERLDANAGAVKQARENSNAMLKRFRSGLASRLEVDDAALSLNDAELEYLQAGFDAFTALENLRYVVGGEITK